jgi:hypothetical protein
MRRADHFQQTWRAHPRTVSEPPPLTSMDRATKRPALPNQALFKFRMAND